MKIEAPATQATILRTRRQDRTEGSQVMSEVTPHILRKAVDLLESTGWIQETYFRVQSGELEPRKTNFLPYEHKASSPGEVKVCGFCMAGAVLYASAEARDIPVNTHIYSFVSHIFIRLQQEKKSGFNSMVEFNDNPLRTKEEVLTMLREMAEFMEKNPDLEEEFRGMFLASPVSHS